MDIAYETALAAAREAGLDPESIRTDYSGRGMFGRTCFGITVDSESEMTEFILALSDEIGREDAKTMARSARSDSMGRSIIYYWPAASITGAPDEIDPEDLDENGPFERLID